MVKIGKLGDHRMTAFGSTNLRVRVVFLGASKGRTPWWGRVLGLKYTHCYTELGACPNVGFQLLAVDLPSGGVCNVYWADEYSTALRTAERDSDVYELFTNCDTSTLTCTLYGLIGTRYEKLNTILHWFGLRRKEPINCLTPMKALIRLAGLEPEGDTPDELHQWIEREYERQEDVAGYPGKPD